MKCVINKTISYLFIALSMLFFGMNFVKAEETASKNDVEIFIRESLGSYYSASGTSEYVYSEGAGIEDNFNGIRVTIVDENGNRLTGTKTIDYYQLPSGYTGPKVIKYGKAHYIGYGYKTQVVNGFSLINNRQYRNSTSSISTLPSTTGVSSPTIDGNAYNPNYENVKSYFKKVSEDFLVKIKFIREFPTIDERKEKLAETLLGQLLVKHGYDFSDSDVVEELCNGTQGGVYIIYEPIMSVIIGNEYAWSEDGKTKISQERINVFNDNPSLFPHLADCTLSETSLQCKNFNWSNIYKFYGGEEKSSGSGLEKFVGKTDYNKYWQYFNHLNDVNKTFPEGLKIAVVKFGVDTSAPYDNALYTLYALQVAKERALLARDNRVYFTGTVTEIAKFVKDGMNNGTIESKYVIFYGGLNRTTSYSNKLYMEKSLDGFEYSSVSGQGTWNQLLSTKGYGLNAIQIFMKQVLCPQCQVVWKNGITNNPEGIIGVKDESGNLITEKHSCCDYSNSDNTTFYYSDINHNQYNKYVFGSGWYNKYCTDTETYCEIADITASNTKCCDVSYYDEEIRSQYTKYSFLIFLKENHNQQFNYCYTPPTDPPPNNPPNSCIFDIETVCPNCDFNTSGKTNDIVNGEDATDENLSQEELDCIFSNSDYYDGNASNKYCGIYCTESISYNFPSNITIEAGRYVTVGNGGMFSPIEIENKKVCRIEKFDANAYKTDLAKAEEELKNAWNEYQIELLKKENIKTLDNDQNCGYKYNTEHFSACRTETLDTANPSLARSTSSTIKNYASYGSFAVYPLAYTGDAGDAYDACERGDYGSSMINSSNGDCITGGNISEYDGCDSSGCYKNKVETTYYCDSRDGYTPTPTADHKCIYYICTAPDSTKEASIWIEPFRYNNKLYSDWKTKQCMGSSNLPVSDASISVKRTAYIEKLGIYNGIIAAMQACHQLENNISNNTFDPEVVLNYNSNKYNLYNIILQGQSTSSVENNFTVINKKVNKLVCNIEGEPCVKNANATFTEYSYGDNAKNIRVELTETVSYSLPNNGTMYEYINKGSAVSSINYIENSIRIGPHLPIAYNTVDENYSITLQVQSLGFNNRLNDSLSSCNDYTCEMNVYKNLIKDEGLDVVYRPISLSNPFPDQDGYGRKTGSNWCYGNDCSNTNKTVEDVITSNRGVTNENLYFDKDPLYRIVLTPSDIMEIRNYNSTHPYGDYTLICKNDGFCYSRFLRGDSADALYSDYSIYSLLGTSCAVSGKESANCNTGEAH